MSEKRYKFLFDLDDSGCRRSLDRGFKDRWKPKEQINLELIHTRIVLVIDAWVH